MFKVHGRWKGGRSKANVIGEKGYGRSEVGVKVNATQAEGKVKVARRTYAWVMVRDTDLFCFPPNLIIFPPPN